MKKIVLRLIPGMIGLVLTLCSLTSCFCEPVERTPGTVIAEMISLYEENGNPEMAEIARLMEELRELDPAQAELWEGLMIYWQQLNSTPVRPENLPEGLPEDHRLCIVVLGYQLDPDGGIRPELEGRLQTALTCARQYPEAYVLCTGGATATKNREATEAERMGEWLIQNGLEPERLILEKNAMSTVDNAEYSAEILYRDYPEVDTVAIVSSSYHIPWGQLLYEAVFRLNTALKGMPEIHAAGHAAYVTENPAYSDPVGFQVSGLKSLLRRMMGTE